jgi:hypothetical protein
MPIASTQGTIDGTSHHVEVSLLAEKGVLECASVNTIYPYTGPNQSYAVIYLASNETPSIIPLIQLAAGYVGSEVGVHWTGKITLEPTLVIVARIFGDQTTYPYRLSVKTEI